MAKIIETLAQVTAPGRRGFTAGIVLQGAGADRDQDRVVEAAPILRRHLKNKTRREARRIAQERGWRVNVIWQMERHLP